MMPPSFIEHACPLGREVRSQSTQRSLLLFNRNRLCLGHQRPVIDQPWAIAVKHRQRIEPLAQRLHQRRWLDLLQQRPSCLDPQRCAQLQPQISG